MSIKEDDSGSVDDILQVFRICKLARIFKLGRRSPGLQVSINSFIKIVNQSFY